VGGGFEGARLRPFALLESCTLGREDFCQVHANWEQLTLGSAELAAPDGSSVTSALAASYVPVGRGDSNLAPPVREEGRGGSNGGLGQYRKPVRR
jgi:hypothetical protein